MAFDIQGALKEGYSAKEINDYLVREGGYKFDLAGARNEGYSDDEILGHLASISPAEAKPAQEEPKAKIATPAPAPAPVQETPAAPKRDYGLQLENPVEGEDYDAPTQAEKALVDNTANAMRSFAPEEIKRGLGVGTRSVIKGLGSITEPFRAVLNMGNRALGGDPDYFKSTGTWLADDVLNLPKPQGKLENILQGGVEYAAGALPWLGTGRLLAGAGQALNTMPTTAQAVGRVMAERPVEQLVASTLAGGAGEAVRQNGGGEGAQLAAELMAGLTPAASLSAARVAGRGLGAAGRALDMFTANGQKRVAGDILARASGREYDDAIRAAANAETIVPGSSPTLAEVMPGGNMAQLEKAVASGGQGQAIGKRYAENAAARQAQVDKVADAAEARISARLGARGNALPTGIDADTAGPAIRSVYNDNYKAARQATNAAYRAVDPTNAPVFDIGPIYTKNAEFLAQNRFDKVPDEVQHIQKLLQEDVSAGRKVTYTDVQALRSRLREMERSAHLKGELDQERIVGNLRRNVDEYLDDPANGLTAQQSAQHQAAKQARIDQSNAFEKGANEKLSMRGNSLTGQAIADPAIAGNYFSKGVMGGENIRAFKMMAKGNAKAERALTDYARGLLHSTAFDAKGNLSSAKIAQFRKDYASALKELPDLKREIEKLEGFVRRQERATAGLRTVARRNKDVLGLDPKVDLQGEMGQRFGLVTPDNPTATGTFRPEEIDALAAVQRDARRTKAAADAAAVRGSPTAQILATQELARRFWGNPSASTGSSWLGSFISGLGRQVGKKLYEGVNDDINRQLVSAMLDPGYAAFLMRLAGKPVQRENLLDLIARSGIGAANVSARTALADRD